METIFKVRMTVYDSLYFPNKLGEIKEIRVSNDGYPIIVEFREEDKIKSIQSYTFEGCYKKDSTPTLSTKPYKVVLEGFEQKAPKPTFEDAISWLRDKNLYDVSISEDSTVTYFPKKENYPVFEALRKLIILRDYYNEGWQPDWNNDTIKKYRIINFGNCICTTDNSNRISTVLSFKSKEIRDKFREEQKELLEIVKPLL